MASPGTRAAALAAAAALVGPSANAKLVLDRPEELARAATRIADLLLPWLEQTAQLPVSYGSGGSGAAEASDTPAGAGGGGGHSAGQHGRETQ